MKAPEGAGTIFFAHMALKQDSFFVGIIRGIKRYQRLFSMTCERTIISLTIFSPAIAQYDFYPTFTRSPNIHPSINHR